MKKEKIRTKLSIRNFIENYLILWFVTSIFLLYYLHKLSCDWFIEFLFLINIVFSIIFSLGILGDDKFIDEVVNELFRLNKKREKEKKEFYKI